LILKRLADARTLRTLGPANQFRLVADRAAIRADRDDPAYVTVEITDAAGNLFIVISLI